VRTADIVATAWDPATAEGVDGLPPFARMAEMGRALGVFTDGEAERWLTALDDEARAGRFFLTLGLRAVVGTVPG